MMSAAIIAAVRGRCLLPLQVSRRDDKFKQRRLHEFLAPAETVPEQTALSGAQIMAADMEVS